MPDAPKDEEAMSPFELAINTQNPVTSGANPINTISFQGLVFGGGAGSSTSASSELPTPNAIFGQTTLQTALGSPLLIGAVALVAFMILRR
jgi:hypothetical protein